MVPNGQSMLDLRYSVRIYAKVFRSYLLMRTYISNALHPALVITQKRHILKWIDFTLNRLAGLNNWLI